ncbi:unnamed protein product [Adineta ricciae]|uniref:Uncharacterized protein n=1 Tax=Adineta ricciae TaxID=249248 RepID=A0A814GE83_ADIRI|nr:unnamed protein product [Adineta ricciae]
MNSNSFVYDTGNKALREHNFDIFIAFQHFIVDLYNQLSEEYKELSLDTYGGQCISGEEFISMNSLLFTFTRPSAGNWYADASTHSGSSLKRVVFQFKLNLQLLEARLFAYIGNHSQHPDEIEVFVPRGTIFRIEEVTHDETTDIWCIKLKLSSKENVEHEMKRLGETRNHNSLGQCLVNTAKRKFFSIDYQ